MEKQTLNELPATDPCSPPDLTVLVSSLKLFDQPGRVLATARVKITSPVITIACGPWRVISRHGLGESVVPPDIREGGRWVPAVSLPREVLAQVEDAVLEAFHAQRGVTVDAIAS